MDLDTLSRENIKLKEENEKLKLENQELITRLKKYTNTQSHRNYYEIHKDEIKNNATKYLEKLKNTNPDKLKEYRQRAYQKRKEKQKLEIN